MHKTQIIEAAELYNKAISICDAVLLNMVGYEDAQDKKAQAQAALKKLMGSVDSSFYSSDVHKNNVGKILFSGKNIVAGKETASQFTTKYTDDSNIYAIAYLPMKIKSIEPNQSFEGTYIGYETVTAKAQITVDGQISQFGAIPVPVNIQDYQANKGYITFELLPNSKSTVGYNLSAWYNNIFKSLKSGKHVVSIELMLNNTKVATGEFEIDWTNPDLKKISKNIELCNKIAADYRANLRKVPTQFSQKHKQYKDASLSDAKIKALFMKKFPNATKIVKFVNIGTSTDSWSVEKNYLGIPTTRYSTMETWVLYQAKDGWSYITQIKLRAAYAGGGKYNAPYIFVDMAPAQIATKNVK